MSETITTRRLGEARQGKTDWKRIDALSDADIGKAIQEDSDACVGDREWFRQAMVLRPVRDKEPVTVRLDSDMVTWFRNQGRGYQTRMNAILRAWYEAHQDKAGRRV